MFTFCKKINYSSKHYGSKRSHKNQTGSWQRALGQWLQAVRPVAFILGMMQVIKVTAEVPALSPLSSPARQCSHGSATRVFVEPCVSQKLVGNLGR